MPTSREVLQNLPFRLPINTEYYKVMDCRTYVRTANRIIALVALESQYAKEIKFYRWRWNSKKEEWKVDHANFKVNRLNLNKVAADAIEMAGELGIELAWE